MNNDLFLKKLTNNNFRRTSERLQLFELLASLDGPQSIADLVKKSQAFADRSTVYRTLETFEKVGVTTRVYTGWKYKIELSDTFSPHHHHMLCMKCHQVIAFKESQEFEKELSKLESLHSFAIKSHTLELQGICKKCS